MIAWLRRWMRPTGHRQEEVDEVLHALRNRAQVEEAKRHVIRRRNEQLEDAFFPTRPRRRPAHD